MHFNEISDAVVDSAMKVHTALGPGLLESVYEACLVHELRKRGIRTASQLPMPVNYVRLAQLITLLKLSGKFVWPADQLQCGAPARWIRRMVQGDSLSPCPQWLRPWFPPKDRLACCGGFVQSGDARGVGCIQHHLRIFLNFFGD
jgi:hypothetical protein